MKTISLHFSQRMRCPTLYTRGKNHGGSILRIKSTSRANRITPTGGGVGNATSESLPQKDELSMGSKIHPAVTVKVSLHHQRGYYIGI